MKKGHWKHLRWHWSNLSLRTKGIVVLALPLAAILLNSIATQVLLTRQQEAENWVRHTLSVRVSLGAILTEISRLNLLLSSFSTTQDIQYLLKADRAKADVPRAIDKVQDLTVDNPRQQTRIRQLRQAVAICVSYAYQHFVWSQNTAKVPSAQVQEARRTLYRVLKEMDDEETALEVGRSSRLSYVQGLLKILVPITLFVGGAGGVLGIWLFLTGIERRAAFLKQQVADLAEGKLLVKAEGHEDEIGEVSSGLVAASRLLTEKQRKLLQEIAERELAETKVSEQREQLKLTLETANDTFIATDSAGRIIQWNRAAETLFGWKAREILGRSCRTLIPERFQQAHLASVQRYRETRSSKLLGKPIELIAQNRAGREVPVEVTIWSLATNGGLSFQSFLRDISERKEAEGRKQREGDLARLLQEITATANRANSPDEAVLICLEHICKNAGFDLAHLYEIDRLADELVSTGLWYDSNPDRFWAFRDFSAKVSLGRDKGVPALVLSAREPIWLESIPESPNLVRRAIGTQVGILSAFAFPVKAGNQILGVLEFFSTETRPRDEMLLATSVQIGAQLGHVMMRKRMEASLTEAKDAAEHATEAKSAFLASMSHEIRTPMNAILGMAELLSETPLSTEQKRYVDVFRRAGSNLLTLINDILDLSKIESGHFLLETIPFNLQEVCDRTVELIRPKAAAKGLMLNARVKPAVPTALLGDPVRLQQIMLNLLGNAVKFTERGGIVLTVGPAKSGTPGTIEFEVADTGIGISSEKLEAIFDDFQQGDSSITRKYGGTGLGLGITKRLVELMKGEIAVESTPGSGSIFRFTASFEISEPLNTLPGAVLEDLREKRVLVVDDNATNRLIFRETLQSWGFEVADHAGSEEASLELASAKQRDLPFSLIILDANMPDGDGFEAAVKLRAVSPKVPILMLTSDNRPGEATRCRALGISHYVEKPVPRTELLRLICEVLRGEAVGEAPVEIPVQQSVVEISMHPTGLRLLVAEDSADNRFLLKAYLANSNHTLIFVENGQEAFEIFQREDFDLVLMDVQMPVMDGLAAVTLIRIWERQQRRERTPIVALTANALPSDLDASRDAGCTAHLSKPISKIGLLSALKEYAPQPKRRTDMTNGPNIVTIPEGLEELVPSYLNGRKQDLRTLANLLETSAFGDIQKICHNLKGTGTSYGFERISYFGGLMETAAKESDRARLSEGLQKLAHYVESVELRTAEAIQER